MAVAVWYPRKSEEDFARKKEWTGRAQEGRRPDPKNNYTYARAHASSPINRSLEASLLSGLTVINVGHKFYLCLKSDSGVRDSQTRNEVNPTQRTTTTSKRKEDNNITIS